MHALLTLLILAFLVPASQPGPRDMPLICTEHGLQPLPGAPHDGHDARDCVKCHVAVVGLSTTAPVTHAARFLPVAAPELSVAVHGPPAPAPGPARGPPPSA